MAIELLEDYALIGVIFGLILIAFGFLSAPRRLLPVIIGLTMLLVVGAVILNIGVVRYENNPNLIVDTNSTGGKNIVGLAEVKTTITPQQDAFLFLLGNLGFYGGVIGFASIFGYFLAGEKVS